MHKRNSRAFTLVEVIISMAIVVLTLGLTVGVVTSVFRMMYKDAQRLDTDATLRYTTGQIAMRAMSASQFYIFPTYQSIDGTTNVTSDVAPVDATNAGDYYGDCLLLVTPVSDASVSNIRQFIIFYRIVTSASQDGELRYYESVDFGAGGTATPLNTLLSGVNLNSDPRPTRSRILAKIAHGRARPTSGNYPIFSSDSNTSTPTPTPQSISVNMEIINSGNRMQSSSSFNYTISPRR